MSKSTLRKRININDRTDIVYVYNIKDKLCYDDEYDINQYFYKEYEDHRKDYKYMVVRLIDDNHTFDFEYYKNDTELFSIYKAFKMFTKKDRSSFKYWFAHWCAFQLTALNLGIWKPKYLLHDIEKPWLKLLWRGDYKKVQSWHRTHNRHHLEYGLEHGWDSIDWEALMIDWECCGLSKQEAQLDARETLAYEIEREKWKPYANEISNHLEKYLNLYNM